MQNFIVAPLSAAQIGATYPLIREVVPWLDFPGWTKFAQQVANPRRAQRSGIIVVQRQNGQPSGLVSYRKEQSLRYGNLLTAEHFVALDLVDPETVVAVLVDALEEKGRELDCNAVQSILHGTASGQAASLIAAGHRLDGTVLCKSLERQIH